MHKHLLAVTLALALLPTASASDTPVETPAAFAAGRVIDSDHVELTITLGSQQSHGEVVPLCQGHPPVQVGTYVLGTPNASCFQVLYIDTADHTPPLFHTWTTSTHVTITGSGGPGPFCDPVRATILPDQGPPITPNIDEACIAAIIEHLI